MGVSTGRDGDTRPRSVDFGAGPVAVPAGTRHLELSAWGAVPVPMTGPVRWEALDTLDVTAVTWWGADRGFSAAVGSRPGITTVVWCEPPPLVDLTGTAAAVVEIGGGVHTLALPDSVRSCVLRDGAVPESVTALDAGRHLDLRTWGTVSAVGVPAGLTDVERLHVAAGSEVTLGPLATLTNLTDLTVSWSDAGGGLSDAAALTALPRLRRLALVGGHRCDPVSLPNLPELRELEVDGVSRADAVSLRARYRATAVSLRLRHVRSGLWLRANVDTPFRFWGCCRGARADASRAYALALYGVCRRPQRGGQILRRFLATFAEIRRDHQRLRDTDHERVRTAFVELAGHVEVSEHDALRWFDAWQELAPRSTG
ncbi:hypothetical protein KZZ52_18510 [Dactylosporangium sp. AC04546]|uniref:hypothetical protein n=1 Tax=Dactylosporangium sp. AC04546 TaxID=2862460 RepID=UPI001EE0E204|nr:hypothetical protein [Dactylosporangium sp. AC04546]WVK87296.1 hypothetical protein KZZ52_18510 [Dactylosporangium sp. AC04546]